MCTVLSDEIVAPWEGDGCVGTPGSLLGAAHVPFPDWGTVTWECSVCGNLSICTLRAPLCMHNSTLVRSLANQSEVWKLLWLGPRLILN